MGGVEPPGNNRNILECKYLSHSTNVVNILEIIETYWNVNGLTVLLSII